MRTEAEMQQVRELLALDLSTHEVSRRTGVPPSTIARWARGQTEAFGPRPAVCWRPDDPTAYAYLLGLYLGDGCLSVSSRGGVLLRVTLDAAYPAIIDECAEAMMAVCSHRLCRIIRCRDREAFYVESGGRQWLHAFPQHGPGRKHTRSIALEPWQEHIVEQDTELFLRGLLHSDGCRAINRFKTRLPSGRVAEYAYPRYFFTNYSADILGLFCAACDRLEIRWTRSSKKNVSVAHRDSVARLDEFVGPKA